MRQEKIAIAILSGLVIILGLTIFFQYTQSQAIEVSPSQTITIDEFYKEFSVYQARTDSLIDKEIENRKLTRNLFERIDVLEDLLEIKDRQISSMQTYIERVDDTVRLEIKNRLSKIEAKVNK